MAASQRLPSARAREEDDLQYGHGPLSREELDEKYPNRPHNHSQTFFFSELYLSLFDPLSQNTKNPKAARTKSKISPHEQRRQIIDRFVLRWRSEVGNDIYPAFRLIMPDKDRDRPVYGLKEAVIARLLIKLLRIDPKSEDGLHMSQWKFVSGGNRNSSAGDFAGRCYDVLLKRNERTEPGNIRIAKVNHLLDKLAGAQGEREQLPIFEEFYANMNSVELKWLIRIILKQMKVGATEKTFFSSWHKNAEAVFNVSSSLRRVCWELTDPSLSLDDDEAGGIELMSCFKPQLAQFQSSSFNKMVEKMGMSPDHPEFWIEEKLDGERMQMHMIEDEDTPGGFRFAFYSRKGKDYTYLYGKGFQDHGSSALTVHIKDAFSPDLRNIILDGEMIEWDYNPESGRDTMTDFGTLKTAANEQLKNSFKEGGRPLFRVFDCLFINDTDLTKYMLRERRKALERVMTNVHRRIEIHPYTEKKTADDIKPALEDVIEKGAEGLVLKNPFSPYRLNERNDQWMKVKPEYMNEFGENLDCVVIGAFYGSGSRGGGMSSFLCGLRADQSVRGHTPEKFHSFFKVGGGFRREDYAQIAHHTDGKWVDWDTRNPPKQYIELGGPNGLGEKPDRWIRPSESFVVEVKAAQVVPSDQFRTRFTLRFPRFKRLRMDKDWASALSVEEFRDLKERAETEHNENMTVDSKRKTISKRLKKQLVIAGNDSKIKTPYAGPATKIFEGLYFCILSEMLQPKKSKAEIEQIIKSNGGSIVQNSLAKENTICVGDKRVVKVASLIKGGQTNLVRPSWVLDAIRQAENDGPGRERLIIPFEPQHMFHTTPDDIESIEGNVDMYGDSYARDVTVDELKKIFDNMALIKDTKFSSNQFINQLEEHGSGIGEMGGSLFRGCVAWFAPGEDSHSREAQGERTIAYNRFRFGNGTTALDENDPNLTHVIALDGNLLSVKQLRAKVLEARRTKLPRIVDWRWLRDSWNEKTLLDEESYALGN